MGAGPIIGQHGGRDNLELGRVLAAGEVAVRREDLLVTDRRLETCGVRHVIHDLHPAIGQEHPVLPLRHQPVAVLPMAIVRPRWRVLHFIGKVINDVLSRRVFGYLNQFSLQ